jgi:GAF domain-containing protein
VPLVSEGTLLGVFDLDSPELDRFGPVDQRGLEEIAAIYLASVEGRD